jgi:hypothetical protein
MIVLDITERNLWFTLPNQTFTHETYFDLRHINRIVNRNNQVYEYL